MKSKFCYVCSAILLCANTFGMKRPVDSNNYDKSYTHSVEIKKQKILNEKRESIGDLFGNYDYQEAIDFFKEVCEYESHPTFTWDNTLVDNTKLQKVDFGEFDQRKKFVDMFENNNGENVSNFIQVNFSYGRLHHNMFIEQSKNRQKYDTNNFLFWNHVNFDEQQASDTIEAYVKPYLSNENKTGILEKFINHPERIQKFATNVLRIMKLSSKGIVPVNLWNMDIDRVLTFEAFEIAGMILSTERLRSKKSLLLSYIEFYKLKHTENSQEGLSMLESMFNRNKAVSTLKFPASGGRKSIQEAPYKYVYEKFLEMIKYSPEYSTIQQCKDENFRKKLMDEFFHGKLEKIRAVLENRQPEFKSEFKSAIQDYLQNAMENTPSPNDEIKRLTSTPEETESHY